MNRIVTYFKKLPPKEATKFLIIFYIVGISGFLLPQTRNLFELLIPFSLCINLFMLFIFHKPFDNKHLLFFGGVVVLTFSIEALGVKTGVVFGEYFYGKSLSLKIFETPLLIGFNWLMLTYGVVQLLRINIHTRKYTIILGAIMLTGFDFIMEPVAMKTDMWSWMFNQIPLQNYIVWFLVSAVVISGFELFQIKTENKIAGRIFILQVIFFAALNLFLK
jgi:putative membrane protein